MNLNKLIDEYKELLESYTRIVRIINEYRGEDRIIVEKITQEVCR